MHRAVPVAQVNSCKDGLRYDGRTSDMIFPVAHLVSFLSAVCTLEPGDLNCRSGTPQREPAAPGLFVDRAS